MDERLLLRPLEVAHALGVGRSRVYELINAGLIPSLRLGGSVRVPVSALKDWIAKQAGDTGNPT